MSGLLNTPVFEQQLGSFKTLPWSDHTLPEVVTLVPHSGWFDRIRETLAEMKRTQRLRNNANEAWRHWHALASDGDPDQPPGWVQLLSSGFDSI